MATMSNRRLIVETPPFRSALSREGGYGEIQRTRPQTLAYGLNFTTWSDASRCPWRVRGSQERLCAGRAAG